MATLKSPSWNEYLCNNENCTTVVVENPIASNGWINRSSTDDAHEFINPQHSYLNTKDEDRVNNSHEQVLLLGPKINDVNPETNNTCSSFPNAPVLKFNNK